MFFSMNKQRGVKAVDRSKFREYQRVAQHFYDAAKDSIYVYVEEKPCVSYLGKILTPFTTKELWKRLERFREWAVSILSR
jgi:hypothetical protein